MLKNYIVNGVDHVCQNLHVMFDDIGGNGTQGMASFGIAVVVPEFSQHAFSLLPVALGQAFYGGFSAAFLNDPPRLVDLLRGQRFFGQ